jgi:hypothetical protein
MGESELLHRLYTNAAGDAAGARAIALDERDAFAMVSRDVLDGLDDLLRKTQPAGKETAFVVRRFSQSYACVVASYPDLVRDAEGRPGFLNHARLVRATEPSFDAAALVELAESIPIGEICATPEATRLNAYVDLISGETSVNVRPVSVGELQQLPRTFLEEFLTACLAGCGKQERTAFAVQGHDHATAWAALPFALQRISSWGVGVENHCPVDAIFSSDGKPPARIASAALVECVKRYVHLLHDAPQEFLAILRNPAVATVVKLDEVVRRAAVAAPMRAQESEMQTKKTRVPREDADPLDADTVAELKRQYDAMALSVRDYVDKRTASLDTRSQAPSIATLWVPIVAVLSLLLSGAALYFSLRKTPTVTQPRETREVEVPAPVYTEPEPSPPPDVVNPASRAVVAAVKSGKWGDTLRDFLVAEPEFSARAIASLNDPALDQFALLIRDRVDLKPEGRDRLRTQFLKSLAAEKNLTTADVIRAYGVKAEKPQDVQSAVILRWMASLGR